jgi:hypothetical protein
MLQQRQWVNGSCAAVAVFALVSLCHPVRADNLITGEPSKVAAS